MRNITLAVDDGLLDQARIVAAENRTTVNAMVRTFLKQAVARRELGKAENGHAEVGGRDASSDGKSVRNETTHQRMQRLLDEGRAKYADRDWFDLEYTYDRDFQRAEGYFENRAALLRLIDESTADMGKQKWNREALYDR